MNRRQALALGAGLACSSLLRGAAANQEKFNIVFLLADDLGWSDTSTYGGDLVETPNLDRLSKSGVRFTNAYAASPVCSPTRASFLTGKYPARLHMTTWYEAAENPPHDKKLVPPVCEHNLRLTETTIAKQFHERGYLTAHVGKWHLGSPEYYPENHGFDINIGGTLWGAPQSHFYPYRGSAHFGGGPRYVPHLEWGKPGEYLADRLTNEALNIISKAKDRPFYLNLWHYSVHVPVEAPASTIKHCQERLRPGMHHTNAAYAAMVDNLDQNIGRVLDHLERLKLTDRTIVIFASDNGAYTGKSQGEKLTDNYPLRAGKGSLYEGGIRVPWIVKWPGVARPDSLCADPVISNDLKATLLAGALHESAGDIEVADGRNLIPLLRDPKATLNRDALFFHFPHYYEAVTPMSAIRLKNWKLLEFFEDNHCELYDLSNDISETRNLAPAYPGKVAELRNRLHAWRREVNAQMPSVNSQRG